VVTGPVAHLKAVEVTQVLARQIDQQNNKAISLNGRFLYLFNDCMPGSGYIGAVFHSEVSLDYEQPRLLLASCRRFKETLNLTGELDLCLERAEDTVGTRLATELLGQLSQVLVRQKVL